MLASLTDLVLPRRCVVCRRPSEPWCPACRPDGPGIAVDLEDLPVWAAAHYGGAVREVLLRYKERGRRDLALPLGILLALAIRAVRTAGSHVSARVVLVPVPSARAAVAARGGDHTARLAAVAATRTRSRVASGGLRIGRRVEDSAGLGVLARERNLFGAFQARRAPPGWSAIIVDDIVTSGATLRESRRALLEAGWPVLGAATVAATPKWSAPSLPRREPDRGAPS